MKQLALNISEHNFEEGLRYSKLILDCFGQEPFDLEILKKAFSELSHEQEQALISHYDLFEIDEKDYFPKTLFSAKKKLFELNEKYHFLLITQITFLEKERSKIISQYISDNNILLEDTDLERCIVTNLRRGGINTIGDLVNHTYKEIASIRDIGKIKLNKIQFILSKYNLTLD